jgi:uncharacterized protein YjbJ (UPF0337 family)
MAGALDQANTQRPGPSRRRSGLGQTTLEESRMNWDRIEGNWKQARGKVQVQWGKLTNDQLDVIAGKREQLVGRVQENYGIAKDEAERQVDRFASSLKDEDFPT